jgi:LruC domain-containing protein
MNQFTRCCLIAVSLGATLPVAHGATVASTRLRGVIEKGFGSIDLLRAGVQSRDLTMAQLEAFRRDNGGKLSFAIDVNEAANGLEKSASQGVAVEYARVEITTASGSVVQFGDFVTETQSAVAKAGQPTRSLRYTLIGDGGSRLITNSLSTSDINGSSFDATIRIPVSLDLSTSTAARLVVKFLDTNEALGDPESFYDYSNGFEDVAIATSTDALYLDQAAPGRTEAPLVLLAPTSTLLASTTSPTAPVASRTYFPSSDQFYTVAYEDQFPKRGDYDFNDLVVAYRVYFELDSSGNAVGIGGEGYLVARGGGFDTDWHLRLPLPATASGNGTVTVFAPDQLTPLAGHPRKVNFNGAADLQVFTNLATLWRDGGNDFVNTPKDQALVRGHRFTFQLRLDSALPANQLPATPFDPYLYVYNTGYEIHLPGRNAVLGNSLNVRDGQTGFVDPSGYPFAMVLPQDWQVPVEYIDLGLAYGDFLGFVRGDAAKQDWYARPATGRTKATGPALWKW